MSRLSKWSGFWKTNLFVLGSFPKESSFVKGAIVLEQSPILIGLFATRDAFCKGALSTRGHFYENLRFFVEKSPICLGLFSKRDQCN
mmetsp:Transcript_92896/g.149986  ORF Transcript_92896/g.149986 Transcript_92896/m.149986 type:complete len:87 (-) Transcript_92896:197-457(-)